MNHLIEPLSGQSFRESGLVSVIIPTYNHAIYIRDAIQSVLRQTYPQYEIIVVDDGSNDNTRDVVAEFGDQVKYLRQVNQGLSAARNTGIRAAQGEYIGVLDADDMYEPEFLIRMVTILQADPRAAACYCGFQFVDGLRRPLPQSGTRIVAPERFFTALLDGNYLVPECILVRASCYAQVGPFDRTLRACEDWDMWLRIAHDHKVIGTPEILIHHRVLPGSMSSDPQRMLDNRLAVLAKLFNETEEQDARRLRAYGRAYFATSLEYLQHLDLKKAYHCLQKALLHAPGLFGDFDVYYELACGVQPKGSRGDFASLNFQQNARLIFSFLDDLFHEPQLVPTINPYQRYAYASAYLALGMLGYSAQQNALARGYLLHAAIRQPLFLLKTPLALMLLKSLIGPAIISELKHSFHKA